MIYVKQERIVCRSPNLINNEDKFLIDSSAQMNVMKLLILHGQLICNDKERRSIKGIYVNNT